MNAQATSLFTATGDAVQPVAQSPSNVRVMKWPCNYNNKLGCVGFIHLDLAPAEKPIRSQVEALTFRIIPTDGSHAPVDVKLIDMLYCSLHKIPTAFTLASHGMDTFEFVKFMIEKHEGKVNIDSEVALYYYKRP